MKIVANIPPPPTDIITLSDVLKEKQGIIVCVYGRHVSFLTPYRNKQVGFWEAGSLEAESLLPFNSISDTVRETIEINLGYNEFKVYYFSTLEEFCNAALQNKWKLY